MPYFFGNKQITKTVHVPAHDVKVVDYDAYWALDYEGNEDSIEDAQNFYPKVAFPSLADAQRQMQLERRAREQQSRVDREATRKHKQEHRQAQKIRLQQERNHNEQH
jgi:hypothetical protein